MYNSKERGEVVELQSWWIHELQFVLPDLERKILIYWDITTRKSSVVDTEKLFEGGTYDQDEIGGDKDLDNTTVTRPSTHKKSMEDGFPLVLIKLRMGLSTIDLAESFCVTERPVENIFLTWINYSYVTPGRIKI